MDENDAKLIKKVILKVSEYNFAGKYFVILTGFFTNSRNIIVV